MPIWTHTCVYVSLLCIPISFFIWSIVGQTRQIIFWGMKKTSTRNLHIVKTSYQWMKAIIFRVFNHFVHSPTNYRFFESCLILSYEKWEENWNSHSESLFNTWTLCVYKERSVFWYVSASRLWNVFLAFLRSILDEKMISPVISDTDHSFER